MADLSSVLALVFGASGWGVAVFKILVDFREDRRKDREDARKEREELRKEQEERSRIAEQIAPFIRELNDGEIPSASETEIGDSGEAERSSERKPNGVPG